MGRRLRRFRPGALSFLWALGATTTSTSCGAFVLSSGGSIPWREAAATRRRPMTATRCSGSWLRYPSSLDSVSSHHPHSKPIHSQQRQRRRGQGLREYGRNDRDRGNEEAQCDSSEHVVLAHDDNSRIRTRRIDPESNLPQRDERQKVKLSFGQDPLSADRTLVDDERRNGLLVLLTVPLAWGTFEPAVRFVYREVSGPIPPFVFSLMYYSVAAVTLSLLATASHEGTNTRSKSVASDVVGASSEVVNASSADDFEWPLRGGLELGTYLFVGNALQLLGLQTIASDRAAFLLQLTTIFVPLAEAAIMKSWKAVSYRVWAACLVALLGVSVMGLDGGEVGGMTTNVITNCLKAYPTVSMGDLYVVGAAVAYTFHCIRLEPYAQATSAVKLAACKATTEAMWTVMSVILFVTYYLGTQESSMNESVNALSQFALESGRDIAVYADAAWNGFRDLSRQGDAAWVGSVLSSRIAPSAAAVLWTGWVTVAYTIYAQSYGQRRVRPVTANLIYTIQPVCTALVAWLVLGEALGLAGYAGGVLIGGAVLLVTTTNSTTTQASDEKESR